MYGKISRTLVEVVRPHVNLLTVDKPVYSNLELGINIFIQGIEGNHGSVFPHNHFDTQETEILHIPVGSHYGGSDILPIETVGNSRIIKPTPKDGFPIHGSLDEISYGQWLSIKLDSRKMRHNSSIPENTVFNGIVHSLHSNVLNKPLQMMVVDSLSSRIKKANNNYGVILGLPFIEDLSVGATYDAYCGSCDDLPSDLGRYLIIKD